MTQAPKHVAVHPIVLLSVVDHYNRVVNKNQNKRVVGVLLGEYFKGQLDVTNCYALPFEEDTQQQNIWFLDHLYHEQMYSMFKKINAKEKVVGWYTTGTKFKQHDLEINELFRKYTPNPVLIIIDPEHQDQLAIPTEAYITVDEVKSDGRQAKVFMHIPSSVEATEPEEIGVEALLREIKDISLNSLGNNVNQKVLSLKGLIEKMNLIKLYLDNIVDKKIKPNNEILYNLQEIFNYLPNLSDTEVIKSMYVKNNDMMFVVYICSLIRSTLSLHNLINNKLSIKEQEQKQANSLVEQKTQEKNEVAKKLKDENKTENTNKK